ncbi:SRPBCC domain-containing protein [Cryobacterium sinapicolor]|uniref:SRPBCC domain-containing protein n=1 Tax=Cryobacterium sinapicolor TaxID=1259236 RepID=A0ABY2JG83_9MICO|nr:MULTISPECIES: SRPBCC domain-containing protein [Cryobacterium]TFC91541.1 SRPBCC domain-containing protein [Cryobacterium sp. TMT3-29-2]TFD05051.1 SRPBCC domain-containing protein [Cryobacterium sinapicolor]
MDKLHFTIRVDAPVHTVWTTMLDESTYRDWTRTFHEGSHYVGSWAQGGLIRFLAPDQNGSHSGLVATVIENRRDEFISLEIRGEVSRGIDDTTSAHARRFAGAHEDYSFSESDGVTTLVVEVDTDEEFTAMFAADWPRALARLAELAEERASTAD